MSTSAAFPRRLASLVASNSDILAALGLAGQVVAVDSHSDAPGLESARRLGLDLDIDVQALQEAAPDLVLASLSVPGQDRVVAQVQAAGLPTLVLDPVTLPQVMADIWLVGERLGVPERAEAVVRAFQDELRDLRPTLPRPPRVVVEWWPRPIIAATRDSWVTDLLSELGAVNAFAQRPGRSTPLTLQEVRDAQPDLIVCSWCGAKKLRPEVIEARGLGVPVVAIHESGLGRPGPRLIEGARQLSEALKNLNI
ncbi:helical backbone metal receptor [Deinococcus sp. VB343]|uniref:Helical backbone metal receptor n=1 Tax=Deinococcus sp. VB142 TaxID=3112952 RepID=A0AAU6Q386_9DEIO